MASAIKSKNTDTAVTGSEGSVRTVRLPKSASGPPLRRGAAAEPAPLSFAQERLWFLDQINPGDVSANISRAIRIDGDLRHDLLEQSLQAIVDRHELLRTTFATTQLTAGIDGRPVQLVANKCRIEIPLIDLTCGALEQSEAKARNIAGVEARRPFDLALGPLVRVILLKLCEREHVLLVNLHRIVCDDASLEILLDDLWTGYCASANDSDLPMTPQIQYSDYAVSQRESLDGDEFATTLDFWRANLRGAPVVIDLPSDRPRPPIQTGKGQSAGFGLEKELIEQLRMIAVAEDTVLAKVLLAAFYIVLARHSRQKDLLVGSTIPNRDSATLKRLIGPVSNLLPLRINLSGDPTFRTLLSHVNRVTLETQAHQAIPFERLLEELQFQRSLSHAPVFQVVFDLKEMCGTRTEVADLKLSNFEFDDCVTRFDLMVEIFESANQLDFRFGYNTDLFDRATVERLGGHFKRVLEGIVSDPDQNISALPLLSEPEEEQVLVNWNNTRTNLAQAACITQLFEAQVAVTPEAPAVISKEQFLNYAELNRSANQLAHYLRGLGVGPEDKVGICIKRSIEMAVAVLAVLKAGAAYVPLDSMYPPERLRFMIDDADPLVLLTDQESVEKLRAQGRAILSLDQDRARWAGESEDNSNVRIESDNLAYVIYTSGSTGQPKGVAMTQAALVNLLTWQRAHFGPARTLQFASLSFDVSFQEMLSSWCSGGVVVMVAEELRQDPQALLRFISAEKIQRLFLPFVFLQHLAEICDGSDKIPLDLTEVITAGEQLEITPQIARFMSRLDRVALHNHYGPSETHVATAYELAGPVTEWSRLPSIGRPIANTRIYILDANSSPVPIGVAGELCIGGVAVSRGYLNRSDLTAEKFTPDPFSIQPNARIYRTGDLARYLADGNIEFLGRIDNQVKIRGYRIELGEIEAVLREHDAVRDVAVVARQGKLVAYVCESMERPSHEVNLWSELRGFIKSKLPEYMAPSIFVKLDALPLTASGKINRQALPVPDESRPDLQQAFVAPRDRLEEQLATLWTNVLPLKSIGVRDNFFELGGDSLLAARLFAQIENRFGQHLPLATLFQSPTIEQLANVLRESGASKEWSSLVAIQPEGSRPPLFCVHAAGANVLIYRPMARHLGHDQPVYALQAQGLDGQSPPLKRVEDMAALYIKEIRAFQPEGPYFLLGASFGGLVAFEMAQQFLAQGQQVALLAMLNTNCPLYTFAKRVRCHIGHLMERGVRGYANEVGKTLKRRRTNQAVLGNSGSENNTVPDPELAKVLERHREVDESLVRTVRAILDAEQDYALAQTEYPGKITFFWAQDAVRDFEDNRLGWRRIAGGGFDLHVVPGTHTSMREEPLVAHLVQRLRPYLPTA